MNDHAAGPSPAISIVVPVCDEERSLAARVDFIFKERAAEGGARVGWALATVWWQLQPTLGCRFRQFVLYSKHNVWAGRRADWHYGNARTYLTAPAGVGLAVAHRPAWIAGRLAAGAKCIWIRREGLSLPRLPDPIQFLGVGMILPTFDAAMSRGWVHTLVHRPAPRRAGVAHAALPKAASERA